MAAQPSEERLEALELRVHVQEGARSRSGIRGVKQDVAEVRSRMTQMGQQVEALGALEDASSVGILFLFGAFCALWAQNTRRNAWVWFFLGLLFHVLALLVLLWKNANDRRRRPG